MALASIRRARVEPAVHKPARALPFEGNQDSSYISFKGNIWEFFYKTGWFPY
jgi:hypothetical protein